MKRIVSGCSLVKKRKFIDVQALTCKLHYHTAFNSNGTKFSNFDNQNYECNNKSLSLSHSSTIVDQIPTLKDYLRGKVNINPINVKHIPQEGSNKTPYLEHYFYGHGKNVYFETYGCQMNVSDTEIVWSILLTAGYSRCLSAETADVVLILTCAIREGAEQRIWGRISLLRALKKKRLEHKSRLVVGILGCMAERLKNKLLETPGSVDLVAGPDAYRDLPLLLSVTSSGHTAINVQLSLEETYADVLPVRLDRNNVTAFVSIMRGCDNMCSYCIVPFTRGRERSRPMTSIVEEVRLLSQQGVKEITLLGQNVNSYWDRSEQSYCISEIPESNSTGFKSIYKPKLGGARFTDLLDRISLVDPEMRIRFTSPHPKDFPDRLLYLIRDRPNICKNIHLPAQSGSTSVLERMRRGYTREAYMALVHRVRSVIPEVALSSDFIAGFCGESEADHQATLSLLREVQYDLAYMFAFSLREKTHAHRHFEDDVPHEVKQRRLSEIIELYRSIAVAKNCRLVGSRQLVLVESDSKRSPDYFQGRADSFLRYVFPKAKIPCKVSGLPNVDIRPGNYVEVEVERTTLATALARPICVSSIEIFHDQ